MKTIEEQAKEYGLKVYQVWDSSVIATRAEDGFKAGAKAAQRWIPVEEELPERFTTILIKRSRPFHLYPITGFLGSKENNFYSNESANILQNVTHWRPIE